MLNRIVLILSILFLLVGQSPIVSAAGGKNGILKACKAKLKALKEREGCQSAGGGSFSHPGMKVSCKKGISYQVITVNDKNFRGCDAVRKKNNRVVGHDIDRFDKSGKKMAAKERVDKSKDFKKVRKQSQKLIGKDRSKLVQTHDENGSKAKASIVRSSGKTEKKSPFLSEKSKDCFAHGKCKDVQIKTAAISNQ